MSVPPICPHCQQEAELFEDSSRFFRKNHGPVWACLPCDARVGCHRGTTEPLGIPARADTRYWRAKAHEALDGAWRARARHPDRIKTLERTRAYRLLGRALSLSRDECHIGKFDIDTCQRTIALVSDGLIDEPK